jgi:hypothetical protein
MPVHRIAVQPGEVGRVALDDDRAPAIQTPDATNSSQIMTSQEGAGGVLRE